MMDNDIIAEAIGWAARDFDISILSFSLPEERKFGNITAMMNTTIIEFDGTETTARHLARSFAHYLRQPRVLLTLISDDVTLFEYEEYEK